MWNCYNLEETNLTRRLKRHGLNSSSSNSSSSSSSIKLRGPSRGRNQVWRAKHFLQTARQSQQLEFPLQNHEAVYLDHMYFLDIFLYPASSINIGAGSLVNNHAYIPLFSSQVMKSQLVVKDNICK